MKRELRKELAELWKQPPRTDVFFGMAYVYRDLYSTMDETNLTADHYLLLADTCKLKNIELGCKVIRLTFKQGRSHDITTAYLISDLENIGQEAIEQVTGELVIKIPDEYKEFLLNEWGQEGHNYHNIRYAYHLSWHGIKNTLAKILDNKIRCLETDNFDRRMEYVESFCGGV